MSPWASRRKAIILGIIILFILASVFYIFWNFFRPEPSCFDGIKNGDESGVDCGGSCTIVCQADIIKPITRWDPRVFEFLPGVWSVLVYVENPNTNIDGSYVPYKFTFYDSNNLVIKEIEKATVLPKNKTVGIFEGNISFDKDKKPKKVVFEIGDDIVWKRNEKKSSSISINHTPLLRVDSAPRVEATVKNEEIYDLRKIEFVIAVFDSADNVIASSRTFLDEIKKGQSSNIFFTWPKPFDLGSKICLKSSDIILALDRSGSMGSLGGNPVEPLNSAKEAAKYFVKQMGENEKIGFISFANEVKNPIDSILTQNFDSVLSAIDAVSIDKSSTQYTNIFEAIKNSKQELNSSNSREGSFKILIFLTDGVATNPRDPNGKSEEDDIKYAEKLALEEAFAAKKEGIEIYTIGLGQNINESFLKDLASFEKNYFYAPSSEDLLSIYKNISENICKEVPSRIEITYKVFGDFAE